ncbi:3-deoxy-D-manno-octulosonic acid transferase [Jannaschia seosinensis]|uniref:3-deoxy-D-manno-octulosonic acid transferase n=1 Tax=Jannaschia seosinensis TaxID=313367 RepID=A0A0M7BAZ0_9RHOB|nr:glycosyltransferase N-terminal domain-containing protein [Jannaschia seosinensis]CUH38984.1 3-deoxy-D-manno-octulosonic acid transferase [Jannaschia seosinensis]
MPRSPLLGAYLAFAEHGARWGDRVLRRRLAAGKEDAARLEERRGIASLPRPEGPLIWLHAASVGESVSLLEMIRRIGEERPELSFLLTTGTVTSAQALSDRLPEGVVHQYVPLDLRPWMRRFLDHWRPDLCVLAEGEIWPGLIHETSARGVPIAMINARMTDGAHRRWRVARRAAAALLSRIDAVQAQEAETAERLLSLGLPRRRLEVTGTLKEGSAALPHDEAERQRLAALLNGRPVWLAASTHESEEAIAAAAHSAARRSWHKLLLIIAPRHPHRADAIAAELRGAGWKLARRSAGEEITDETQIYLADTIGEMGLWYRLCPVSLIGGSLMEIGGHNPFEPAALGSAILHGRHVHNFADIYARLRAADAALEVDEKSLAPAVVRTLESDEAARLAHAAWSVCSEGADVTEKAVDLLLAMLDGVA